MKTPQEFKAAITKIKNLHPSASIFSRAHQVISSPNAQMNEIVNIVKLDTALTADIIRFSNSGAIGRGSPAADLQTAIRRVGLHQVDHFLALSISRNVMNQNLPCYGITAFDYWSNSVSVALLMELLAKQAREDAGEAYTLGVLHAIGRLVINQLFGDLGASSAWDGIKPIDSWERESVGFTSASAGALLLKEWGFPESFCEIIENQLTPDKVKNPAKLLKMLNFCIRLLLVTGVGFTKKEWSLSESDPFLLEFKISLAKIKEVVELASQKHAEAQTSLEIVS